MYGFDDEFAYLIDTDQQGGTVKTTLKNLELARNEKGPMSSKNKSFTIEQIGDIPNMNKTIKKAISNNAQAYLNPPITNISYKGIKKTAKEIKKWFNNSEDIKGEFQMSSTLMERAGTGGALFRNLYRDFLKESSEITQMKAIHIAHNDFKTIASLWTDIANLFHKIGETKDEKFLDEAAKIFIELSEREKHTMEVLKGACA